MTRHPLRVAVLALLLSGIATIAGCNVLAWTLSKTAAPFVPEEEVQAEYSLQGRSLVVLVDVKNPLVASEFPRSTAALSDALGKILTDRKACGPIVPSYSIEAARQAEPQFQQWSVAQVGQYFNVDLVMHVEVLDFRVKEPSSSDIYQGYAETTVCLVSPGTGEQVWPVLAAARTVTAETLPDVDIDNPGQQETLLVEGLAEKIARQFYTYKKEELPLRPKAK